jgi:hypothetical protein
MRFKSSGLATATGLWETVRMSETLCECGHPEANHPTGICRAEIPMKDNPNRFVRCQCNQFNSNGEEISQSAAAIVSGENED